jgi:hypothetical protein
MWMMTMRRREREVLAAAAAGIEWEASSQ